MAEETAAEDRTEAATPRRLQRAREQGQVAMSRELPAFASLSAFALLLVLAAPTIAGWATFRLAILFRRFDLAPAAAMRLAFGAGAAAVAPAMAVALLAGVGAVLVQTGLVISPAPLRPDLARLSPGAGLRRLLGADAAIETVKALVRLVAMGLAVWYGLAAALPALEAATYRDPRGLPSVAMAIVLHVLLAVLAVQAMVTIGDVIWVRLRHARGLRMSREELREEQKDTEGDPHIKARLRQLRLQRARRRMLAAVPTATVVVTNPTHYAVALAYDRARNAAPRVVAKGVDSMAARIRETALAHGVPLVANPPLARALHRLEIDAEIPPEHYKAVAELIAYVWRLGARAAAGPLGA